jgi:Family of unknown function (DUF6174)
MIAAALLASLALFAQGPPSTPDPSIRDGSAQQRLDDARARWRDADIHSYRFELTRRCFCPPASPVLRVRHDRAVRPPADFRNVATVRRLFRHIQAAINDEVHVLQVRYGKRGVPRRIAIDGRELVADDEITYEVRRFWR